MDSHDPRANRTPTVLWVCQNGTGNRSGLSAQERQILKMIALGAPVRVILNKLCTMINLEIGDVVSVVWLPAERGSHLGPKRPTAIQMGLDVFSSTDIFAHKKTLLGILEIYTCDSRLPVPHENQLIERVARLVGIALQCHNGAEELESSSRNSRSEMAAAVIQKPPLIN